MKIRRVIACALFLILAGSSLGQPGPDFTLQAGTIEFVLYFDGFRFGFRNSAGHEYVQPHPESGLLAGHPKAFAPASTTELTDAQPNAATFKVTTRNGLWLTVGLSMTGGIARFDVEHVAGTPIAMALQSAGDIRGFGLGDHNVDLRRYGGERDRNGYVIPLDTDVTGIAHDNVSANNSHLTRMTNNFVIYPERRMALVNIDPRPKMIRHTEEAILQGSVSTARMDRFYYFFGESEAIYKAWLDVRNEAGYKVWLPNYTMFGVGWEAYGALAWNTSQTTVTENVDRYLDLGYPLKWMVVGSGFWPKEEERFYATTSFGMWDSELYPDPEGLKHYFRGKGLDILLGLRIAFLLKGPFSEEGYQNGYFRKTEGGGTRIYRPYGFPRTPAYLLEARNPEAVAWYADLADRWGADGFKEDLYSFERYDDLPDDRLVLVNDELKRRGYHIILRSSYLGSAGDIHRIEDFNYNQFQDRGPVNTLSLAYSGLPLTYLDIVGGTLAGRTDEELQNDRVRMYMMRNARTASVHPSMSFGLGPWRLADEQTARVMLASAQMHDRLHPYFYSQAIRFYQSGFPWTMVPLPLLWPDDPDVYGRANTKVRGYSWMIGDALLAVPLYGDDYDSASSRDVYLPEGVWIDYDTGERYEGSRILSDFPIPVEKTPLFVGGTGIVIEQVDGQNVVRVYPVTDTVETSFWGADGTTHSNIQIIRPDWADPSVYDVTAGVIVPHEVIRHAIQFPLSDGHDYIVR